MSTRKYLGVKEAANLIGVEEKTIRNWIAQGVLPAYKLGGKVVIILEELEESVRRNPIGGDRDK